VLVMLIGCLWSWALQVISSPSHRTAFSTGTRQDLDLTATQQELSRRIAFLESALTEQQRVTEAAGGAAQPLRTAQGALRALQLQTANLQTVALLRERVAFMRAAKGTEQLAALLDCDAELVRPPRGRVVTLRSWTEGSHQSNWVTALPTSGLQTNIRFALHDTRDEQHLPALETMTERLQSIARHLQRLTAPPPPPLSVTPAEVEAEEGDLRAAGEAPTVAEARIAALEERVARGEGHEPELGEANIRKDSPPRVSHQPHLNLMERAARVVVEAGGRRR
jgi:hypothetical protein